VASATGKWIASMIVALTLAAVAASQAPAQAETAQSAQVAAQQLVRSLNAGGVARPRTDPSFTRLMHENSRLATDSIDLMDADPICQCQDGGGHYRLLSVTPRGADLADDAAQQRCFEGH
jgi:hypothetical protein